MIAVIDYGVGNLFSIKSSFLDKFIMTKKGKNMLFKKAYFFQIKKTFKTEDTEYKHQIV